MIDLHFAQPQWVHLIWGVLLFIIVLWWLDRRGMGRLDLFLSEVMQNRLVRQPSYARRLMRITLLGLAGMCLVVALMRPQWGLVHVQTPRVGAEIMVCLDVSRSMLAQDTAPSRLGRAKAEVRDLLSYLDQDHVGLIAFAGKATVLCPMTPDFGFLRMVLDTAGPHSVARGGTNLEAPIRKALAGFRGVSDLSRAIILITDGEDHESFVKDAAQVAIDRGIRIIAIGFGDEAGSEVYVTDSHTGARTRLLDANKQPVVSRLDSALLRELALASDGAYIPAGTGALDLRSIYDAHIAPMTRSRMDDRGRLVRQEGFQWAVLMGLGFLLAVVAVSGGGGDSRFGGRSAPVMVAMVVGMVVSMAVVPVHAQGSPATTPTGSDTSIVQAGTSDTDQDTRDNQEDENVDPRQAYNQAVGLLQAGHLDRAEAMFDQARQHAGTDAMTRYRATYNLGCVQVDIANGLIDEQPEQALTHLQAAADWFRQAVQLQPDETQPRENFEITSRRMLALADALADHESRDLPGQIDELITRQRGVITQMQAHVRSDEPTGVDAIEPSSREALREVEIQQRQMLAALEDTFEHARERMDVIEAVLEDERAAEQRVEVAQLSNTLTYLHRAMQRLGQARLQWRRRAAQRAYRRGALGLADLKQARDQFRDISQVLGVIITDAAHLNDQAGALAASHGPTIAIDAAVPAPPAWLTREYLAEALEAISGRTRELRSRVEAGMGLAATRPSVDDSSSAPSPASPSTQALGPSSEQQPLVEILREAAPLIGEADQAFTAAHQALTSQDEARAYEYVAQAISALIRARELFLDLPGLIELVYSDQQLVRLTVDETLQEKDGISEYLPMLSQLQSINARRGDRLRAMIDQQLMTMADDPAEPTNLGSEAEAASKGLDASHASADTEQQRLELAQQLVAQVNTQFSQIESTIQSLQGLDQPTLTPLQEEIDLSIEQIEALRRLFFSLIEHLQDTARRQMGLADDTRDMGTLTTGADALRQEAGALADRQDRLAAIAQQIAETLVKQSQQNPTAMVDPTGQAPDSASAQASQDVAHRLSQAAEHVEQAKQAMERALVLIQKDQPDLVTAEEPQHAAVQQLIEALALLQPPPQDSSDPQQQEQDPSQQQDGQDDQAEQERNKDESDQKSDQQMNAAQWLQAVRDREAQRIKDRQQKQAGHAPVEKDW